MSIYDKASLVLIPSGTKTSKVYSQVPTNGDGDFTFSRSTAATRVNASGNIEKETGNLLTRSKSLNIISGGWGLSNATSATAADFDGGNAANELTGTGFIYQPLTGFSGVHTFSVYVKAGTWEGVRIRIDIASNSPQAYFNLSTGVLYSGANYIDAQITDVGNDWYRITITGNVVSPNNLRIYPVDTTSVGGTGNIILYKAQGEQSLVARDYIETTTTAIYGGITDNVPRLDYTDSSCPALLLEPQRFNAIDSSEYGGAWAAINANITKTENATTSPEGVNNAVKLEGLTTSSANQIVNFGTTSLNGVNVVGKTYTASVYLKPVNAGDVGTDIVLSIQRNSGDFEGFNVTTEITSADWKRYDLTYTFTGAGAANQIGANFKILRDGGTSIDDIYIWGVQFEEGSYATSYIPTYGSAVTRNADASLVTGVSSLIGQTQGTLFLEAEAQSGFRTFSICDGSTSNRITIAHNVPASFVTIPVYGGVVGTQLSTSYTSGNIKIAVTYSGGNYSMFVNGTKINSASIGTFSSTLNKIEFAQGNGGNPFAGDAKQVLVFPTALTDQEAIDLTTL